MYYRNSSMLKQKKGTNTESLTIQRNFYWTKTNSKPYSKADCQTFLKNTFTPTSTKIQKEDQDLNPFTAIC